MITLPSHSKEVLCVGPSNTRHSERGAALAIALLMMILLSAVALGVLAVVQGEAKISGSDLKRTEACYASAAAMEIMTNNFSALFAHTSRPTTAELAEITDTDPPELTNPTDPTNIAYTFPEHSITPLPTPSPSPAPLPKTVPNGPFAGLIAGITSYTLTTTAQSSLAQCKLTRDMNNYLIPLFQFGMFSDKDIELHPGPDFTFNGRVHANGNIYVNGSVKFLDKVTVANELVYDVLRNGSTRSGATVSMVVGGIDVPLNKGSVNNGPNLPTATASPLGQRGWFPGSPNGTDNATWNSTSVAVATGTPNKFGGQLLTRTTGAAQLKLPLQLDGSPTRELIKRRVTNDNPVSTDPSALSQSRYHTKSRIRILIDDEVPNLVDTSGIPAGQGVALSAFNPVLLPNTAISPLFAFNGGGRALWRINDNNTSSADSYLITNPIVLQQQQTGGVTAPQADTVRGVRAAPAATVITAASKTTGNPISITSAAHGFVTNDLVVIAGGTASTQNTSSNTYWPITVTGVNTFTLNNSNAVTLGTYAAGGTAYKLVRSAANNTVIPYGAGITGRILIQIVDAAGNEFDVTQQILSMGMTEGEPNSIIQLQRPLWAAFTQGSRDASGGTNQNLADILNTTSIGADGEISISALSLTGNGYLTGIGEDTIAAQRSDTPPSNAMSSLMSGTVGTNWSSWNAIVPINVYNMREGHLQTSVGQDAVYERGITSIVEVNMRNLARWIDGVYDRNLLAGTNAVSTNIGHLDGYTVYVSDRRGDNVRSMTVANPGSKPVTYSTFNATNGMVDNVDIYGPNGSMDAGEDVQNKGLSVGASLGSATVSPFLKDITELPDPAVLTGTYGTDNLKRAVAVAAWANLDTVTPTNHKYFRSAVRLFNGENLQVTTSVARRLSTTHGLTVSSENMVYIWGNYNTTGINQGPAAGVSSLNESTSLSHYCPGPGAGSACASVIDTQVPASIVADAFFPMSKTWFDSESATFPAAYTTRRADRSMLAGIPGDKQGTSVRAGIIAGNNLGAMDGSPDADNGNDSRMNGGIHNFPRFLEDWLSNNQRWNFVGSFVPLYNSTQALGQWWYITSGNAVYAAPQRNWAFDDTFLQMDRLPPGTPMFQYISPSAFRQVL
jgi:hypothetical protein